MKDRSSVEFSFIGVLHGCLGTRSMVSKTLLLLAYIRPSRPFPPSSMTEYQPLILIHLSGIPFSFPFPGGPTTIS